jgi:hypothetical protein
LPVISQLPATFQAQAGSPELRGMLDVYHKLPATLTAHTPDWVAKISDKQAQSMMGELGYEDYLIQPTEQIAYVFGSFISSSLPANAVLSQGHWDENSMGPSQVAAASTRDTWNGVFATLKDSWWTPQQVQVANTAPAVLASVHVEVGQFHTSPASQVPAAGAARSKINVDFQQEASLPPAHTTASPARPGISP